MARLVTGGQLPPHVMTCCWGGAAFGVMLAVLPDALGALRSSKWFLGLRSTHVVARTVALLEWAMPSGIGFAIGMYILPQFVLPRVMGAVLGMPAVWARIAPAQQRGNMLVTASGLVLGEGIASMMFTFVKSVFVSD
jgi:hypothetical protein